MSEYPVTGKVEVPLEESLGSALEEAKVYAREAITEHEKRHHSGEPPPPDPDPPEPDPPPGEEPPDTEPPPPNETPAEVWKATVLQIGAIRWEFSREVTVGRFVTGDHFAVGSVTITQTPKASIKNPASGKVQALHADLPGFNASLRSQAPFLLEPGDMLLSVSHIAKTPQNSQNTLNVPRPALNQAEVLTCVAEIPPAGAFRPSLWGKRHRQFYASQVRWERVPSLPTVPAMPAQRDLVAAVSGVQTQTVYDAWQGRYFASKANSPHRDQDYGRGFSAWSELAILAACTSLPGWEEILLHMVQFGIDMHSANTEPGDGRAHLEWGDEGGGIGQGHLGAVLWAGWCLDDSEMLSAGMNKPRITFAEHAQPNILDSALKARYSEFFGGLALGTPVWVERLNRDMVAKGYGYKWCCTGNSWLGTDLWVRMLGLQDRFGWPAFFAYNQAYQTEVRRGGYPDWQIAWLPAAKQLWERENARL